MPNKFFARVIAALALGATHRVKKWGNRDQTRCETFCTVGLLQPACASSKFECSCPMISVLAYGARAVDCETVAH